MNKSDHITALFVAGWFYFLTGEEKIANVCWQTAAEVLKHFHSSVGVV